MTITGNTAGLGGGIYCYYSSPSLVNVTISGNRAFGGGGIYCWYYDSPRLSNVTMSGNTAEVDGGGIFCYWSASLSLVNTILWNNSPQEISYSQRWAPSSISVAYSDVQGGEAGIVTNNNGTVNWLQGNFDHDPFFMDPENGDFHLALGSRCIDAGAAFFVWDVDTLVNLSPNDYVGSAPDMGAFELPYTVRIDKDQILPNQFVLYQNYPNPFNVLTTISFQWPEPAFVNLAVYNAAGQLVKRLINESMQPEVQRTQWNATEASSGLYFYKVTAGDYSATSKSLLLK